MTNQQTIEPTNQRSWLDTPLVSVLKLDVEKGLYLLFTLLAILTRFYRLGDRVMSHDESLHTYFSWGLYMGRGFQHTPLMHGPFLFHINALIYSLFGADDFTARISPALFGVALILLPWTLRRWLGRVGALVVSFLFLISPSIMYYARYIRNESYVTVWVMLTLWAMLAYLRTRQTKWLYLFIAANILHFASKEVVFIYTAIFGSFLGLLALIEIARERGLGWDGLTRLLVIALSVVVILAVGVGLVYAILVMRDLGPTPASGGTSLPPLETGDMLLNLFLLSVVGILCGLGVFAVLRALWPEPPGESLALDLVIALGVFYLPTLAPFAIGTALKEEASVYYMPALLALGIKMPGFNPMDYSTLGIVRAGGIFAVFLAVSIAVGLWWSWRRFLIGAGLWYGIGLTLFTTIFTNGGGAATGYIGSLGYWLAQQAVQRGSQPVYYYGIIVPLYEYLPILLSFLALIVYAVRGFSFPGRLASSATDEDKAQAARLERETTLLVVFLIYWIALTWVAYSYAGEKMPWLIVHFALPMILLGGHFLGWLFERIDWRDTLKGWLVAILVPLFVVAMNGMITSLGAGAFRGKELPQLTASGQWLSSFIVALGALVGLSVAVTRAGFGRSARIVGLLALAVPVALTVRHAWMWNFINYDLAVEPGVYAHAGPGVKIALSQIDEISRRTAGEHAIKIAYDSDSSWPYSWYLRDYTNQVYVPSSPTREQLNTPVILAGSASWSTFEAVLGDRYDKFTYRLIWWPMEDYKGKNGQSLTWNEIAFALTNGQMRRALWDIWLNRDYKLYDQITGESHTLDKWPLTHDFRLYVRKDISTQVWDQRIGPVVSVQQQVDPYLQGKREVAGLTLGASGPGSDPKQFNAPHGLAVASDGTLYVADSNNHRIQKFDRNGEFVMAFGGFSGANTANPATGTLNEPWGVAVGPDGSVYVADTWNHRVQKFDSAGEFVKAWGMPGQVEFGGQGGVFWGPRDVAVDKNGRVYVTDTGNKRIQVFSSDGTFITQMGGPGVLPGQLDEPVGIAIDPSTGNIIVADTWNQRIQVLTPDGVPVRQWEVRGWLDQSVTTKPYIAVDKNGNVYVADPTGFRVLVFGSDGTFKLTFGDIGTDEKSFQSPIGIAVDDQGNVYVSDAGLSRVVRFAASDLNLK